MNYQVTWTIDIFDADTPNEAARKALAIQRNRESTATVFSVTDDQGGPTVEVDLEWKLLHKDGRPVKFGESYPDFRGDMDIITGGLPPHNPGSTGRVITDRGMPYFPSVFNMEWMQA